jgi:hypothetical protein
MLPFHIFDHATRQTLAPTYDQAASVAVGTEVIELGTASNCFTVEASVTGTPDWEEGKEGSAAARLVLQGSLSGVNWTDLMEVSVAGPGEPSFASHEGGLLVSRVRLVVADIARGVALSAWVGGNSQPEPGYQSR